MRESDRAHLQELLARAERGDLSRSDAISLLMILRGSVPAASLLRDLGDTVAHDERDRGYSHTQLTAYLRHIEQVFGSGGMLKVPVFAPIEQILDELVQVAADLEVECDRDALGAQQVQLTEVLASVVEGTRLVLEAPSSAHIEFTTARGGEHGFQPLVSIRWDGGFPGGAIRVPDRVAVGFPMFAYYG